MRFISGHRGAYDCCVMTGSTLCNALPYKYKQDAFPQNSSVPRVQLHFLSLRLLCFSPAAMIDEVIECLLMHLNILRKEATHERSAVASDRICS